MDSLHMRWVECPLLDVDGAVLHPPSGSSSDDDDDMPVDLLNRREGHCAAVVFPTCPAGLRCSGSWVVVCGGYSNGSVSAAPLVAPTALLPALQWRRLSPVDVLECDGATLTTVDADSLPATSSVQICPAAASVAYLFGGLDAAMNRRSTLHAVSLHTDADGGPAAVHATEVQCTGAVPDGRARHGAGGHGGRLYIFGGETDTQEQSRDLYVCDVPTGVWRHVAPSSPSPAPRLLSLSLLFVSPTLFVVYGGAHFVQGDVCSFADVWSFDVQREEWAAAPAHGDVDVDEGGSADAPCGVLPRSNGHAGGVFVLSPPTGPTCVCAAFLGGKNVSTGDDAVKLVCFRPAENTVEVCTRSAAAADIGGAVPHWRYTPAVVSTAQGLLLLAGQCRHPQTPSAFLLAVSAGDSAAA